jgi:cytosine/adenosine deaminase-related metal-dependent hydrolase
MFKGRVLGVSESNPLSCCGAALEIAGDLFSEVRSQTRDDHDRNHVIMPPFSNAHDHVRGVKPVSVGAFDMPLELWLIYMSKMPPADPYLITAAALGRQVLGGVGSIMIHYTRPQNPENLGSELEIVARAASDIGVRVSIAVAMRDQNPLGYGPDEQLLKDLDASDRQIIREKLLSQPWSAERSVNFVDELAARIESPLVSVQYGPYGPEWCSRPLLELIARKSADNGRRVHMHVLETRTQREYLDYVFPQGIVTYLDDIGMLSERLSIAHGVWLRPDELELLALRKVTVSVNSSSNLSLRSGIAPLRQMHEMGVRYAMGLDGFSVDDDDDAFRELRLNYLLHQGAGLDDGVPLAGLLRASSYGGRYSVSGIGAEAGIKRGAPADLMVVDYAAISADVFANVEEAPIIARRATSKHICQLVVSGRTIAEGGALTGIDLAAVEQELNAQVRHGMPEFQSWQQVSGRLRDRLAAYYRSGLHRCH